jgi:hypothetical protein
VFCALALENREGVLGKPLREKSARKKKRRSFFVLLARERGARACGKEDLEVSLSRKPGERRGDFRDDLGKKKKRKKKKEKKKRNGEA